MPKICEYQDEEGTRCKKSAVWGNEQYKPIMCKKHKDKEMKNTNMMCKCGKSNNAIFNYEEEKKAVLDMKRLSPWYLKGCDNVKKLRIAINQQNSAKDLLKVINLYDWYKVNFHLCY